MLNACVLIVCVHFSQAVFNVPEIRLDAFQAGGFQVSMVAVDDKIQAFNFHANKNKRISSVDPGDYSEDVTSAQNGLWAYKNSADKLILGDKIHYWVFIQHNQLGYKKSGELEVKSFINPEDLKCRESRTKVGDQPACVGQTLFQDNFDGSAVDSNKWIEEKFIPNDDNQREFGFAYYTPQLCVLSDGSLNIKPQILNENDFYNDLDVSQGCTSPRTRECQQTYTSINIPPGKSCLLSSKFKFKYGSVEIRAQLPKGDWLYPDIYLELINSPRERIYIAYSRGNEALKNEQGLDIGSKTLYFGQANVKSKFPSMVSKTSNENYWTKMRLYRLTWEPNVVELFVDGESYGKANVDARWDGNAKLVVGVGVGGIIDFPQVEGKPWSNTGRFSREEFFNSSSKFTATWTPMVVEYVKLSAI